MLRGARQMKQSLVAEEVYATELAFLAALPGDRPPGWVLTPRAVVSFICGSGRLSIESPPDGVPSGMTISEKFVGDRALVERCVVTLAGRRGLMLVGEPGTAKSMLSELLAAAVSGTSELTVQGTAGTTEDQVRYGWNYAMLIAKGPTPEALVPSPVLMAMRRGQVVRFEEITRCLPEVQDAMVSILSERRLAVTELGEAEAAMQGFNVIGTANLRDRGVSEMSSALKRRFNFETIEPIADAAAELALITRQATAALAAVEKPLAVDEAVLEALVTVFRDLRAGRTEEGWAVEKPETIMSTAEAVGVASSLGLSTAYLHEERDPLALLPGYLLGVVLKDDPRDRERLLSYWDSVVKRRAGDNRIWTQLLGARGALESTS